MHLFFFEAMGKGNSTLRRLTVKDYKYIQMRRRWWKSLSDKEFHEDDLKEREVGEMEG